MNRKERSRDTSISGLRKHKRKQEKRRNFFIKDNNIENKDMENADGNKIDVSNDDNSTDYINVKKKDSQYQKDKRY